MWRFGLMMVAAPLLAQEPLDLVLLIENTPGMQVSISRNDFRAILPEDRVAAMSFTRKSRVIQPFTSDPSKVADAVRRMAVRGPRLTAFPPKPPQPHLLTALMDSVRLFRRLPADPNRRRAIVVIFGSDDDSATPPFEDLQRAFTTAQIRLYAVALRRNDGRNLPNPRIQTPPTFPGSNPPVPADLAPLPETTLQIMARLAAAVGGQALSGDADIPGILRRVRSDADQPERSRAVAGEHIP